MTESLVIRFPCCAADRLRDPPFDMLRPRQTCYDLLGQRLCQPLKRQLLERFDLNGATRCDAFAALEQAFCSASCAWYLADRSAQFVARSVCL